MAAADADERAGYGWLRRIFNMGNYKHFEKDFVERTLQLIAQYESIYHRFDSDNQLNHTLLINCLLGLIVIPKEKAISFLPNSRIVSELKEQMGIVHSTFNPDIKDLKHLIFELRNSIAHSYIYFISKDDKFLIDKIVFKNEYEENDYEIASFVPSELLSFIRYYSNWFTSNIRHHHPDLLKD